MSSQRNITIRFFDTFTDQRYTNTQPWHTGVGLDDGHEYDIIDQLGDDASGLLEEVDARKIHTLDKPVWDWTECSDGVAS